jgi:TolA-binding protein
MALRQGQADEAVVLFAKAAPQHDGRHLFDLALAHLEGTAVDGVEKATAALQQLVTDYPKSSLSQNAGSFIRQLSPRP